MKFSIDQSSLLKTLNIVSKGVSQKTTMPILKGIYMQATLDGILKLVSYDLDFSVESSISCNVEEEGIIVVPAKMFMDIIRKISEEEILFEIEKEDILKIKSYNSEFKIATLAKEDFPNIGEVENVSSTINFSKEKIKELIRKTEFAACTDESQGVITGVYFEIEQDQVNVVALDGFRMSIARDYMISAKNQNILIYSKIIKELYKIIVEIEDYENLNLVIGENKAVFMIKDTKIITRLMEGEFIKYKDILPKDKSTSIIINRADFEDGIERANLIAKEGKHNLIKIEIKENLLNITSSSEEGAVKEEIIIEKEGNDLEIGFNSKYLLDALKKIEEDKIKIYFNSNIAPCLIKPIEGDNYEFLVLPMRISI